MKGVIFIKNWLFVLNPLHPYRDHNSNLILRLIPHMNVNATVCTPNDSFDNNNLPTAIDGIPTIFIKQYSYIEFTFGKLLSHLIGEKKAQKSRYISRAKHKLPFISIKQDAVFSVFQEEFLPVAVASLRKSLPKFLILLDPTDEMAFPEGDISKEPRDFLQILKKHDIIFTTPMIKKSLLSKGYSPYINRICEISFPSITGFSFKRQREDDGKITLLFCGWLYPDIRSPEYMLKIISKLDDRFKILFIGKRCKQVIESFNTQTSATIETYDAISYNEAQQALADADILINIGNSVPVHMPSKTLEYINTGKPFVNFYKFDECPTLHYTKRYPLCLNLSEEDEDIDAVAQKFIDFCVNSKGKRMEQEWIFENYAECTPQYIAKQITDACEELYKK